jgi:hypothetical protein
MTTPDATVMGLLRERVPLSLLCDLLDPAGPHSAEIMAVERGEIRADILGGAYLLQPA